MNIVFAGIIGRYPYGGVAWCSLQYLLGLQRLGHSVWYLEDTGECNFDPVENSLATEPDYALRFIAACLTPYGLGERWCYVDYKGVYHGRSREDWIEICRGADLYINLSGGCWFWRDEYLRIPRSIYIDSDPAFTQLDIERRGPRHAKFFEPFNALFTFGRNIGTDASPIPTGSLKWHHTWQPILLDEWESAEPPQSQCFSTIMTWKIASFQEIGGNKDAEFLKFIELPARTGSCFDLAVSGPKEFLAPGGGKDFLVKHGWRCRDSFGVSSTLDDYRRFIQGSRGEFSVAKHTYVATNSGWFSDRTECYLASGRPAIVQDTGFSAHLPTGSGLIAYKSIDEVIAALDDVNSDYERHSKAAREIASSHFSWEIVLPSLLERAT